MHTFAILAVDKPEVVSERLAQFYHADMYRKVHGGFLLASNESAQQVSSKLNIVGEASGGTSGIVVSFLPYWGHYDRSLWEWLSRQQGF